MEGVHRERSGSSSSVKRRRGAQEEEEDVLDVQDVEERTLGQDCEKN